MIQKQLVKNSDGDELYVLVEGPQDTEKNVVFVHGNGVDMHGDYFDTIVPILNKEGYRVIRFDMRGCGKSGGKQEDGSYSNYADDLDSVLKWSRDEFKGNFYIIAHSMGCSVASTLSPDNIKKAIFTGIPNPDSEFRIENFKKRILSRGGTVDEDVISISVKRDGSKRNYGSQFWKDLREFDAIGSITNFAKKTPIFLVRPEQDDIVPDVGMEKYLNIENIEFVKLSGDHRFDDPQDRANLISKILDFLSS